MGQTLNLKRSRRKWILLGALFVGLAVLFPLLYVTSPRPTPTADDATLLLVGIFTVLFGAGAVLSVLMLTTDRMYLFLTPSGFTARNLFNQKTYRWGEVEEFSTFSSRGNNWVVFTLSREGKLRFTESGLRKFNKALGGGDDNLADTYGMSAEALADLMNQWRKRASGSVIKKL